MAKEFFLATSVIETTGLKQVCCLCNATGLGLVYVYDV